MYSINSIKVFVNQQTMHYRTNLTLKTLLLNKFNVGN